MTIRTSTKSVTFRRPFVLDAYGESQPAGTYKVETDEELLQGLSFPVYRRVLTVLHLNPKPGEPGVARAWNVDPRELDAALARDRAMAEADGAAVARGGNEGTTAGPR